MLPRQVMRIGEAKRGIIYERYMENGLIWDIIANDVVRHERFREIPANVQELYADAGSVKLEQHFTCDPHVTLQWVIFNNHMWLTCEPHVTVTHMWLTCEPHVTVLPTCG